jgi:hypothetical protein
MSISSISPNGKFYYILMVDIDIPPVPDIKDISNTILIYLTYNIYHLIFSYFDGFGVRSNPKLRDDEKIAAEYINIIGCGTEDINLIKLLTLYDSLIMI